MYVYVYVFICIYKVNVCYVLHYIPACLIMCLCVSPYVCIFCVCLCECKAMTGNQLLPNSLVKLCSKSWTCNQQLEHYTGAFNEIDCSEIFSSTSPLVAKWIISNQLYDASISHVYSRVTYDNLDYKLLKCDILGGVTTCNQRTLSGI